MHMIFLSTGPSKLGSGFPIRLQSTDVGPLPPYLRQKNKVSGLREICLLQVNTQKPRGGKARSFLALLFVLH